MRTDMHKVLCEEPRGGQYYGKQFPRPKVPLDHLPNKQGMRRPHRHRKWFGDHLGPLRRWLRSNVARPWNDVYSEACEVIGRCSTVREHLRTHLYQYVERDTFMQDGEVCLWEFGKPIQVKSKRGHTNWPTFYVHPTTGMLLEIPHSTFAKDNWQAKQKALADVVRWITSTEMLLKDRGIWYLCTMAPYPSTKESPYDTFLQTFLYEGHARELYGKRFYVQRKQQLSKPLLKRFQLVNTTSGGIREGVSTDLIGRIYRSKGNPVRDRLQHSATVLKAVSGGESASRNYIWN